MDLQSLVVGGLAIAIGMAFLTSGLRLAVILLPLWGFFAGFVIGAQLLQSITGDGFLATTLSWIVGVVFGLVLAVLSYLVWYVAVVIVFASIGYWLGWGFMTWLGFPTDGFLPFLIGLAVGAVFAAAAFLTGVPVAALIVITAVGGAHAIVAGVLVIFGTIEVEQLGSGIVNAIIAYNIWWWVAALVLAVAGIAAQLRMTREFVLEPPPNRI